MTKLSNKIWYNAMNSRNKATAGITAKLDAQKGLEQGQEACSEGNILHKRCGGVRSLCKKKGI